jgi:Barrel-sandwich domain of CusB or HlyD membrane-fusion
MYVDESGSKVVVVTLLHKPETIGEESPDNKTKDKVPFGCLVAEQIGDELAPTDMHARTEVVSRHASTALWNAQEHHKIFLKPVLKAMGSPWRMFRGRTLAKIGAVLAAVLLFVAAMAFIPCTLTIVGNGSLLPEERHKIYAPLAGIVGEVLVDHDARVKKGDVLIKLDSFDLQKELKSLVADFEKAKSQIVSFGLQQERVRRGQDEQEQLQIQAQLAEAKLTAKFSKERIEILNEQIELMNIRSPQDGVITTWEAKKNLMGRPVEMGQELLQVAAEDGDWILEVEVPDDDMGPVLAAQTKLNQDIKDGKKKVGTPLGAYFVTMTDPEHGYDGYVVRIAPGAETMADAEQYKNRHIVKVTIGFTEAVRQAYLVRNEAKVMRPGAEVRAKIDCGPTSWAYYLLRKPIQVIYESVLFRWPFLS